VCCPTLRAWLEDDDVALGTAREERRETKRDAAVWPVRCLDCFSRACVCAAWLGWLIRVGLARFPFFFKKKIVFLLLIYLFSFLK
jgi:hypothetical protein